MKKSIYVVLLVLCMALALAACSTGVTTPETTSSQTDAPQTETEPEDSQSATEGDAASLAGKTIGVLTPYLSSVTTNQMVDDITASLTALGAKVNAVDTKGDFAALASRIEDVVSSKVDAIVLVSADPGQVAGQLQTAFDANIPVFGCDSGFIDGMTMNASSDNRAMGEEITKYLFDELMDGKGTVIALTHRPHPGVVKRSEAFDEIIKDYPEITLITEQHVEVPNPIENARQLVENLLLSNPEKGSITAIWCAWDEAAIGAAQALKDAGRDEVLVTGVDGNSQAVEMVEEGSNLVATLSQNFEGMADLVVQDINTLLNGGTVEPGEKYAPATLIK